MAVRERKLLRKEINFKLKCMANKESKENDFLNSSQIITERQQMYMTISKFFRAEDNKHRPRNLPFNVDRTSLPHVNLSLLNRIYKSTDATIKSPELKKVFSAHAFRTATPFYTNPDLTVDRGKVMNYSAHVGTILHTPRYIDFLKNAPEYASAVKNQQQHQGSEKIKRHSTTESYSSTTISSMNSHSSKTTTNTESSQSIYLDEQSRSSINSSVKLSKTSTVKSSRGKIMSNQSVGPESKSMTSSSVSYSLKEKEQGEYEEDFLSNSNSENLDQQRLIENKDKIDGPSKSPSFLSPFMTEIVEQQHEVELSSPAEIKMQTPDENPVEDNILNEEPIDVGTSSNFKESITNHNPEQDPGLLIEEYENFFGTRKLNKGEVDVISRFFDTVDKYRHSNPSYVVDYTTFLLNNNNSEGLSEFHRIVYRNQKIELSDEASAYIKDLIRNYVIEDLSEHDERNSNNFDDTVQNEYEPIKEDSNMDEEVNDESEQEKINRNIIATMKRVFPMEEIMENYDIKIETEDDNIEDSNSIKDVENSDDFADAFKRIFRSSISSMDGKDMSNLKKLVNQYDKRKESLIETIVEENNMDFYNKFKTLYMTEKNNITDSDNEDLLCLLDNKTYSSTKIQEFKLLIDENKERINDYEREMVRSLIRYEKQNREEKPPDEDDLDESEENEMMMAFRNLFRSSVGEIKKSDLNEIKRIISEHG